MRILATICFAVIALGVHAQHYGKRFSVGVQASGTVSAILNQQNYGQFELGYRIPFNFGLGVAVEYALSKKFSFVTGVGYLRLGQAYEGASGKTKLYRDTDLSYLVIPVLFKYYPWKQSIGYVGGSSAGGKPEFYMIGGIQPAVLTSVALVWEVNDRRTDFISFITEGGNPNQEIIEQNGRPEEDRDLFSDNDLMLVGGIGVESDVQPNITLYADLRGGIGAFDLNAEEWRLPPANGTYFASRNAYFGLFAGVRFKLF